MYIDREHEPRHLSDAELDEVAGGMTAMDLVIDTLIQIMATQAQSATQAAQRRSI